MPDLHDNDVTVTYSVSVNVVANSNWICVLISDPKIHSECYRLLLDGAADST